MDYAKGASGLRYFDQKLRKRSVLIRNIRVQIVIQNIFNIPGPHLVDRYRK